MRILHYWNRINLSEGGVVRAVLDLCELTAAAGHEVTLVTYDDRDVPEAWSPRVVKIDPPQGRFGRLGADAMGVIERETRAADVVHLHTPWETPNVQVARVARRSGRPYVLTIHGMLDDYSMKQKGAKKRVFLALAGRKLLEDAYRVHCTAAAELEQAAKWFPKGTGVVIPLVFDLDAYRTLPGPQVARRAIPFIAEGDAPVVLFLSRLHYKKGLEVLIDGIAILTERGVPARLVITGTGDEPYVEQLKTRVRERGIEKATHFTGLVVGEEKVSLYEAADVFALPTSQENLGYVLPEALAARTPVVTTKGVDIWPELTESGGAIILEERTPEALADAIQSLFNDPERRARMGERGRAWVFESFEAEKLVKRYADLYEAAIAART